MDDSHETRGEEAEGFEGYPLTRLEYINVLVHFYRGEVQRSTVWRERLDATTNWAVLTTAGMLSLFLSDKHQDHMILLLSNLIILCYLLIEARRFRYFEIYRARVRMLEENFLIPVLTRKLRSPMKGWRELVAGDLDMPKFKTSMIEAVGFRLRRNYIYIFLIVLGGWVVKLLFQPTPARSLGEVWMRVRGDWAPVWVVLGAGFVFYLALAGMMCCGGQIHAGEPEDEVTGVATHQEASLYYFSRCLNNIYFWISISRNDCVFPRIIESYYRKIIGKSFISKAFANSDKST